MVEVCDVETTGCLDLRQIRAALVLGEFQAVSDPTRHETPASTRRSSVDDTVMGLKWRRVLAYHEPSK